AGIDVLGVQNGQIWTQPGTWNFTSMPYVLRSGIVQFTAPLTITAGVVVKELSVGAGISSSILYLTSPFTMQGTSAAPVVFTSVRDASFLGNTDLFEGSLAPAPGDWGSINVGNNASGSVMDHTIVRYGGNASGNGADVYVSGSTGVFFTNGETS